SFALIVYASSYLKAYHPTAFYLGILNAWPMGFYHPATLVRDAQRHGVEIRPIDVQTAGWKCRWEDRPGAAAATVPAPTHPPRAAGAIRLGLRFARGRRARLPLGPHPPSYRREQLPRRGIVTAADLVRYRNGDIVRTAGAVIVRQRPGTAKGLLFLPLEDETGMSQAIVSPDLLQRHRQLIVGSPGLVVEGVLQKRDGSVSVRGERFWALEEMLAVPSHDFR